MKEERILTTIGYLFYFLIYLFIQIAYYTHMGQAITIQKHANIKKKNNTNIINM